MAVESVNCIVLTEHGDEVVWGEVGEFSSPESANRLAQSYDTVLQSTCLG